MNETYKGDAEGWDNLSDDEEKKICHDIEALGFDPGSKVTFKKKTLTFYPGYILVQAEIPAEAKNKTKYFIWKEGEVVQLDWTSPQIHALNTRIDLTLTEDKVADYLRFFCDFVCGEEGPFTVIEDGTHPRFGEVSDEYFKKADYGENVTKDEAKEKIREELIKPVVMKLEEDGKFTTKACVWYEKALFQVSLIVNAKGSVEMVDDIPKMAFDFEYPTPTGVTLWSKATTATEKAPVDKSKTTAPEDAGVAKPEPEDKNLSILRNYVKENFGASVIIIYGKDDLVGNAAKVLWNTPLLEEEKTTINNATKNFQYPKEFGVLSGHRLITLEGEIKNGVFVEDRKPNAEDRKPSGLPIWRLKPEKKCEPEPASNTLEEIKDKEEKERLLKEFAYFVPVLIDNANSIRHREVSEVSEVSGDVTLYEIKMDIAGDHYVYLYSSGIGSEKNFLELKRGKKLVKEELEKLYKDVIAERAKRNDETAPGGTTSLTKEHNIAAGVNIKPASELAEQVLKEKRTEQGGH